MGPHEPYLSGLRRGFSEGVVDSYQARRKFARDRDSLTDDQKRTVENLYWHCIHYLDDHVADLLSFVPDDVVVAIMGDHGEEFDHGAYRYARLYDECVRVPLFTKNLAGVTADIAVRQLDLAPSVLDELGIDAPDAWEGRPATGEPRPSFMLSHSPHLGASYVGKRTPEAKLIRTYEGSVDESTSAEFFDLGDDPHETENLYRVASRREQVRTFERAVGEFVDRDGIREGLQYGTSLGREEEHGDEVGVEERLKALGYK
jgi:arylsulfatase A-like enzyme